MDAGFALLKGKPQAGLFAVVGRPDASVELLKRVRNGAIGTTRRRGGPLWLRPLPRRDVSGCQELSMRRALA